MRERVNTIHTRLAYYWEASLMPCSPRDLMTGRRPSLTNSGLRDDADLRAITNYLHMVNYGWMGAGLVGFGLNFVAYAVLYFAAGEPTALVAGACMTGLILGCSSGCVNAWYHMYYRAHRAKRLARAGAPAAAYEDALRRIRPSHRSLKYQALIAIATAALMIALWT